MIVYIDAEVGQVNVPGEDEEWSSWFLMIIFDSESVDKIGSDCMAPSNRLVKSSLEGK